MEVHIRNDFEDGIFEVTIVERNQRNFISKRSEYMLLCRVRAAIYGIFWEKTDLSELQNKSIIQPSCKSTIGY
jgi:4-diphosphocytidyl-2-C-methyl-D-erythritol kinase